MKLPAWNRRIMGWLIFVGIMCVIPQVIPPGFVRICVFANYLAVFAMSWDILSGYTGYASFGHNFIIGIAAYGSAILSDRFGFPLYASMPIGIGVGLGAGMLFFLPGLRLRGNYFCLVTIALLIIAHHLVVAVRPDITGGTKGIIGLEAFVTGAIPHYYISLAIMAVAAIVLWRITKSDLGSIFHAIRMDEDIVSTAGLNTFKYKLIAFILSALVGSIGGVFYIHFLGAITPDTVFSIDFLLTIIIATLIGGQQSIIGPIIGAYFLTFLLEYLRIFDALAGPQRFLIYSAIALVLYMRKSSGIFGIIQNVIQLYKRKRGGGEEYAKIT